MRFLLASATMAERGSRGGLADPSRRPDMIFSVPVVPPPGRAARNPVPRCAALAALRQISRAARGGCGRGERAPRRLSDPARLWTRGTPTRAGTSGGKTHRAGQRDWRRIGAALGRLSWPPSGANRPADGAVRYGAPAAAATFVIG